MNNHLPWNTIVTAVALLLTSGADGAETPSYHNLAEAQGGFEIGPGQPPDLRPAAQWKCALTNGKAVLDCKVFHGGAHSLRLEPLSGRSFSVMTWADCPPAKNCEWGFF
ncbi:MAG: hypothetical protein HY360_21105 [Verrucomicrobia bacterium]|nr:hypothetical protein [Verrucomicrobiota bacterium]